MDFEWSTGALALGALVCAMATSADAGNREQLGGSQGSIAWESLLPGEGLDGWTEDGDPWSRGAFSRDGDTIIVETEDNYRARIVFGDDSWRAYELKVNITPIKGGSPQLWFNIHDGQDHHFAPLYGWQTAAIMDPHHTKLDVVNHVFEWNVEYEVVLAVRGNSVTTYIDGQLVNRLTMSEVPAGPIGLAAWGHNTVARFRDPMIRHYYKAKSH